MRNKKLNIDYSIYKKIKTEMENLQETPMLPLFETAINFIKNTEKKSNLNNNSYLSMKLGVVGRFMLPLNSETAYLIGMSDENSEKLTGLDSLESGFVTILVSPPLSGPCSDYPLWHIYAISTENEICHKIPTM